MIFAALSRRVAPGLVIAGLSLIGGRTHAAPPAPASPPAASDTANRPVLHLALQLTRTDKAATNPAPSVTPTPAAAATVTPVTVATPSMTTFDRGTATISVTAADLSYSVALSPSLEKANNGIQKAQILWNIRLAGKVLPGGASTVTLSGASRIPLEGTPHGIAEITLTDPQTGQGAIYRLEGVITVGGD